MFHVKENVASLSTPIEVSFRSQSTAHGYSHNVINEEIKSEHINVAQKHFMKIKSDITVTRNKNLKKKKAKSQIKANIKKNEEQLIRSRDKKDETAKFQHNDTGVGDFSLSSNEKSNGQYFFCKNLSFDNQNFKYSYYEGQIIRKIGQQWRCVGKYEKLRTLIYFKIHKDGTISDACIREMSGNSEYDQNALDTIFRAAPFPSLPENYIEQTLGVFFEFKYKN
ncbi:MAG: TonB C-terminal domain-containing protein [Endomicrobium sp.]|jgi:protein TonB|nr:TonB C-terminal domain-containing protein [Endomicrobium sp.]